MAVRRAYVFAAILLSRGLPAAGVLLKQPFPKIFEAVEEDYSNEANESVPHDPRFTPGGPAPDGGWESVDPSARPSWWRPEGSVLPSRGSKIALAFRGDYHRWTNSGWANGHTDGKACSDYWVSKDNIYSSIVAPLEAAGAQVRFYFHTYKDLACPHYDDELVKDMKPAQFKFDEGYTSGGDLAYSFREVFNLVLEDDWADHVLFTRFDVQYNAPITSWDMNWNLINIPFAHRAQSFVNSDLLITVPRKRFEAFKAGLQKHSHPAVYDGIKVPDSRSHMYVKLFPGVQDVHAIDPLQHTDNDAIGYTFLGIIRNCSVDYDTCMDPR